MKQEKLTKGISGIAGEYLVAGELSRRGFMASVTLRNNDSIDIHASKSNGKRLIAIQVKTNQTGQKSWILTSKSEKLKDENPFYVFVSFKGLLERPDYYIVPSILLATKLTLEHSTWLKGVKKNGTPRKDTPIREFRDLKTEFFERWDLLE